jgi:CubicO group peptidase (beta-lactamase class C family)
VKRVVAFIAAASWFCSAHADPIDDLIVAEMKRQHIPGLSVAIVKDGTIVKEQGYGIANLEHGVPVTADTMFQSASLGKQFTAALVLQLVEDGKIKLDDRVSMHLPGSPESWADITVRHLLNHTSGLAPVDRSIDLRRDYSDREILDSMVKLPLLSSPGEKWSYSNLGYQLLGILCSSVGGKFYGDQLRERVFVPSGMKASVVSDRSIVRHRAAGYDRVNGTIVNEEWVAPSLNATADGGMYVSARDLARWSIALDADHVLSTEMKDISWAPTKLKDGSTVEYGFGWELRSINGHRSVQHGGAWRGFSTFIVRYLDDKLSIVVLANRSRTRPEFVAEQIVGLYIPDLKISPPTTATFGAVPSFVRGSMNGWRADRDRLVQVSEGVYETEIDLGPGRHTFRIASEDWTAIDFGAPFDESALSVELTKRLEWRGENLIVNAPRAAKYLFRLNVRDPSEPNLKVSQREPTEQEHGMSPGGGRD